MKYLIKVSPEITIKSKAVRKQAIKLLSRNIRSHLKIFLGPDDFDVKAMWDKIEFTMNKEGADEKQIEDTLSKIPWIDSCLLVRGYKLPEWYKKEQDNSEIFKTIFEKTKEFYLDKIEWKTFVVRVKRSWEHNFTSIDLERYLWGGLLKFSENAKVKLKNPDLVVKVDVKDDTFYIVKNTIKWLWGYPIWFQDRVISLISGGFDSGVSTFSMMKRGCKVDFLFFNLWWKAHELWVKQISLFLWKNFSASYKNARFITVDFENVVAELMTKVNHKYRWILLKRYMLKISSMLEGYYAIIKWDSLWQVSSQTLKNMNVIDKASSNLVLRPLISYNKQEIVDISKQIWTYNFSANMPEYCWVISDKPSTWAKEEKILEQEELIDESILKEVFENRRVEKVRDMLVENLEEEIIEMTNFPEKNEIIIDIREEDISQIDPLEIQNVEILNIPFFEINNKFKDLDQSKTYLLYCEKGVLSKLHGLYLKEKWFTNVKMFRELKWSWPCSK